MVCSIQSVVQEYARITENYLDASGRNPTQTGLSKIEYFFTHELESSDVAKPQA